MHRVYLFYTEPGKPMFWEDFRLFCQDFGISPDMIPVQEVAEVFHSIPTRHLSFDDFMGPTILGQLVIRMAGDDKSKMCPPIHNAHGCAPGAGFTSLGAPQGTSGLPATVEHFVHEL